VAELMGNLPGTNKGDKIVFKEPLPNGIREKMLWQKIMSIPVIAIFFTDNFRKKLRITKPNPMVAITSNKKLLKCKSKKIPKFTNVNSSIISQIPLDKRNFREVVISFLFLKER
jgi:hypothetical protein